MKMPRQMRQQIFAKKKQQIDILSPLKEVRFLNTNVAATPS